MFDVHLFLRTRVQTPVILTTMALPFVRPTVRDMDGYTPGEQPAAGERVVKLTTTETPFPPPMT